MFSSGIGLHHARRPVGMPLAQGHSGMRDEGGLLGRGRGFASKLVMSATADRKDLAGSAAGLLPDGHTGQGVRMTESYSVI
jgi:hypothetical protein